jgi:hypothetical protein
VQDGGPVLVQDGDRAWPGTGTGTWPGQGRAWPGTGTGPGPGWGPSLALDGDRAWPVDHLRTGAVRTSMLLSIGKFISHSNISVATNHQIRYLCFTSKNWKRANRSDWTPPPTTTTHHAREYVSPRALVWKLLVAKGKFGRSESPTLLHATAQDCPTDS